MSISSSWQWQIKNALKTEKDFKKIFSLSREEENGFRLGKDIFNIQATPYYVSLADPHNVNDPIRRMIMPLEAETKDLLETQEDPLGENKNRPVKRIIHRYKDRVLFLATDFCGIYCRYCTRKHFTGGGEVFPKKSEYQEAIDYIKEHKEIKEVILSGGDPLTLSDLKLDKILSDLDEIKHIDLIRIGSRLLAACPMRITKDLIKVLKRSKPVVMMVHFNHPNEISDLTREAFSLLVDSGFQVLNQMVLLNGVNNHPAIIYRLSRELLKSRVFPYYMFQCDPSPGTSHLRTSIEESLKIQEELWGRSSGLALPTLSVDIPSGGGKSYLSPNHIVLKNDKGYGFKGFDGVSAFYENPPKSMRLEPFLSGEDIKIWE